MEVRCLEFFWLPKFPDESWPTSTCEVSKLSKIAGKGRSKLPFCTGEQLGRSIEQVVNLNFPGESCTHGRDTLSRSARFPIT